MKKTLLCVMVIAVLASSCSKSSQSVPATILLVKYACGNGCDASSFVVKPESSNNYYQPFNLPASYKKDNLPVMINFTTTGRYPEPFKGPEAEIIHIIGITRR